MAQVEPSKAPVAEYRFEAPEALGRDSTGNGHTASVSQARQVEGIVGRGLLLNEGGGLEIASADRLHAGSGFAIELWVRFARVDNNMNIVSKEGEYFLRLDPPNEGSNISFFMEFGEEREPRVRGPKAEPDVWYHIIATWDGWEAVLWVNGRHFRQTRLGEVKPSDAPLLIGKPSRWGPASLQGILDEVKVYDRSLRDSEIMASELKLLEEYHGQPITQTRFEFATYLEGWQAEGTEPQVIEGALHASVEGMQSRLALRNLLIPVSGLHYVSLRMSATFGERADLIYRTSEGIGHHTIPLHADGRPHSYIVRVADDPWWRGNLRALCLIPSDMPAEVTVDFLRLSAQPEAPPEPRIMRFFVEPPFTRAGRAYEVMAEIANRGGAGALQTKLVVPTGVQLLDSPAARTVRPEPSGLAEEVTWRIRAEQPGPTELRLEVTGGDVTPVGATLAVEFAPFVEQRKYDYVPEPVPAQSEYLVGAHYCPLWKQGSRSSGWELIEPFPLRKPVLGWYDEGDPEVADWEIKWCLEHGIQYFVYCWYRASQGGPVEQRLGHAIHEGLFGSRYGSLFKFAIMWENQSKSRAGVASEEDLLQNLVPFWINNYFKHPSYLKIDNKPLLFIYRPEFLIDDLGSLEKVRSALQKVRAQCQAAGFNDLLILGEYRGDRPQPLQLMADEGLDYAFAYCWPVANNPAPHVAIEAQEAYWRKWLDMGIIPGLVTLSQGWDSTPWHGKSSTVWKLSPGEFRSLCERAKAFMDALPEGHLGRRLVLLDNWNEFGEGHYIAPHREYGFGYLDAVRSVFTDAPEEHLDLVPEDIGRGPYETLYQGRPRIDLTRVREVIGKGVDEPQFLAWWPFDEPDREAYAYDWTGRGAHGLLHEATRTKGLKGQALVCEGGSVQVPRGTFTWPTEQITFECWVKTDTPEQNDKWFVNCVYGQGDTGFRLGLHEGKLCWAIPRSQWSHHLRADEPLPLGRWVHVAATYDGEMMHLYMDGREIGSLKRNGRIHPPNTHLCLGSYDSGHKAHFTGLLDEVRIYSRALAQGEVEGRAKLR
ncbi:MAG: LamG-like jellyroll fold domain-containing protein [Candidatus Zipacnadales bacterium]